MDKIVKDAGYGRYADVKSLALYWDACIAALNRPRDLLTIIKGFKIILIFIWMEILDVIFIFFVDNVKYYFNDDAVW